MKVFLAIMLALSMCGQAFAYDKTLAASYESYFAAFDGHNIPKALRQVPAAKIIEMISAKEDFVIIDVRTRDEQSVVAINYMNTLHIPMNEIFREKNLARIPKDRKVILTCKSGLRCTIITLALHHAGFDNVYAMQGGIAELHRSIGATTRF